MPAAIPIIVSAISTAGAAAAASWSLAATIAITAAVVGLQVVGLVLAKREGKSKYTPQTENRTETIKQAIMKRDFLYGQVRVGGKLLYATEVDDKYLHMVYALATHEVKEITNCYINDSLVTEDMLDSDGFVIRGKFRNKVRIRKFLGTNGQAADADFISEVDEITSTDKFSGIAYVYARYEFDTSIFPTGIPKFSADVKGKKLYDFRDTNTKYSENPALAIYDFMVNTRYGKGEESTRLDTATTFTSTANTCEEMVTVTDVTHDVTPVSNKEFDITVNTSGDTINFSKVSEVYSFPFETADPVKLKFNDATISDTYYVIIVDEGTIKLAETAGDASAGTSTTISGVYNAYKKLLVTTHMPVYTALDTVELDDETSRFATGDKVQVSTTGTLPTGLAVSTDYYAIMKGTRVKPRMQFATSLANAYAGTAISLTARGSGTMTVTKKAEPRYTVNGLFSTEIPPFQVLEELTKCMGGFISYVGGKWFLKAGVYSSPTLYFDEDDIVEAMTVTTKYPGRERFNAVTGTHFSPFHNDQAVNYPAIEPATYLTEDNNKKHDLSIDYPLTNRPQTCQRLSYLYLNKHRLQIRCQIVVGLKGLQTQVGDTIYFSRDKYGWVNKEFEIVEWELLVSSKNGLPTYKVRMGIQEISSAVYSFNHATDEVVPAAPANTNLDSAFSPPAEPTGVTLSSGESDLFVAGDGTVVSRIKVSWDDPDSYVTQHEVQWKLSTDSDFTSRIINMPSTYMHIQPVKDTEDYDIRVRAINQLGGASDWAPNAEGTEHTVIGKSAPPDNVPLLTVSQNGDAVLFRWNKVTNPDLSGYEIRYGLTSQDWDDLTLLTFATKGTQITTVAVPPGTWKFCIKAIDTNGNESTTALCQNLTVTNNQNIVYCGNRESAWLGALRDYPYFAPRDDNKYFYSNAYSGLVCQNATNSNFCMRVAFNTGVPSASGNDYVFATASSVVNDVGVIVRRQQNSIMVVDLIIESGYYQSKWTPTDNTDLDIYVFWDGTTLETYDASGTLLDADSSIVSGSPTVNNEIAVGTASDQDSNNVWVNNIYLVACWNKTKTMTEMKHLDTDGLELHYAFDEPGATTLSDRGSARADLTAYNGAAITSSSRQSFVNPFGTQNFHKNPLKGWLIPNDATDASADNNDVFDNAIVSKHSEYIYREPEVDIGREENTRLWVDTTYSVIDGETGNPNIIDKIDYAGDDSLFDGFENWSIGYIDARYYKFRMELDTTTALTYITKYKPTFDITERTESGKNVTVLTGGTAVTFTKPFFEIPTVQVTMVETGAKIPAAILITTTGFTLYVYDNSGTDVGGVVNWEATGA